MEPLGKSAVLVVDDDQLTRAAIAETLRAEGFRVSAAAGREAAVHHVVSAPPAVVLLDLDTPGPAGIETLRRLKAVAPEIPAIVLTRSGDTSSAVEAMKLGASDHLTKPLQVDEFLSAAQRALERRELMAHIDEFESELRDDGSLRWLMGPSREVQNIIEQVRQVADSTFTILIQGETGSGKELVARAIHQLSSRRQKPFVALDCGAIPDTLIESELFGYERGAFTGADRRKAGYFELADSGTLFFDEVVNLPLTTQAKLLRVLQERRLQPLGGRRAVPVDVRIVAAYNVPLPGEIRAGRFRPDLYYRLNEFVIVLPPLRERREDIPFLAKRFLTEASMELRRPVRGISEAAIEVLLQHPWPGNVRELRNVIRRAVLVSPDLIRPGHLVGLDGEAAPGVALTSDPAAPLGRSLKQIADAAVADAEHRAIRHVLQATRGNKTEAARLLKIDYKTLHVKMKRYRIEAREVEA